MSNAVDPVEEISDALDEARRNFGLYLMSNEPADRHMAIAAAHRFISLFERAATGASTEYLYKETAE